MSVPAELVEGLADIRDHIEAHHADLVRDMSVTNGELTLTVRRTSILNIIAFLRDDPICKFNQLIDLCGVDYPARSRRFEVVYHLLSMAHNQRIRVKVTTDEDTPAQGLPADGLCRSALRRRTQGSRLRTGGPPTGIPVLRFPLPLGRREIRPAGRREERGC